jgi:hypothetical protein
MDRAAGSVLPGLRPKLDHAKLDGLLAQGLHVKAGQHPATGRM